MTFDFEGFDKKDKLERFERLKKMTAGFEIVTDVVLAEEARLKTEIIAHAEDVKQSAESCR
jgi:hypothetical protein